MKLNHLSGHFTGGDVNQIKMSTSLIFLHMGMMSRSAHGGIIIQT